MCALVTDIHTTRRNHGPLSVSLSLGPGRTSEFKSLDWLYLQDEPEPMVLEL